MFEVNRDKEVVWKYTDGKKVGVHHFQILTTNGEPILNPQKINESVFNLSQQIAIKQKSQLEELFDHLQIKRV